MASNKYFTILIVPEKNNKVSRLVIPSYLFKGGILALVFGAVLAIIMILDYANVMNQINENKQLKIENRQLKQSVQVFKNKMVSIENSMDRVKTFVTKLKIITNIEDNSSLTPLQAPTTQPTTTPPVTTPPKLPNQSKVFSPPTSTSASLSDEASEILTEPAYIDQIHSTPEQEKALNSYETLKNKRMVLLAALSTETSDSFVLSDADTSLFVKTEFEKLDSAYDEINAFALAVEQETQNLLERLGEKRTLLARTPTRIPTLGYITSEYGVRISPYDGRRKMHEGIDIANRFGADIIATADGLVDFAGIKPGYGKLVVLNHGNGIETRYAHNSRFFVAAGQRVKRGQRIAAVGNTGHSTGPHCHYEVHANGLPVDPCWYILDQPGLCRQR